MALVCHCEAVKERAVNRAIRSGARSVAAVASMCGAGSRCAGCHPVIDELIDEHLASSHTPVGIRSATI
jgi:bacterioferritin-associated ferredoxin